MNWPKGYQDRIELVFGSKMHDGAFEMSFKYESPKQGKLLLKKFRLIELELQAIKREVSADMTEIRRIYKVKKQNVNPSFFTVLFGGSRSEVARARQVLDKELNLLLNPYKNLSSFIDDSLLAIAKTKVDVEIRIQEMIDSPSI